MSSDILLRLLNRIAAAGFRKMAARRCRSCGSSPRVAFGWSVVHPECVSIGDGFSASANLRLQAWPEYRGRPTGFAPELTVGSNVTMISGCHVSCMNRVTIGDGCLFGDNVFVTDNFHGQAASAADLAVPPALRDLSSAGPVTIGKNVWLGRNVCVMPGVTIGDDAVVGANAVVTRDIPPRCVAAGVPARVIRTVT